MVALYIVATPIGNMADFSQRAIDTLKSVDCIAAEDTRHSMPLLNRYGVATPLMALHDHNEAQQTELILSRLESGQSVALISDAGTPLISDPGYILVNRARQAGFAVISVPGPSAITAALSIAGLATDKFTFLGFLPAKPQARQAVLTDIQYWRHTCVFYESTHRLMPTLQDIVKILGQNRELAVVKELTKKHEKVLRGPACQVYDELHMTPVLQKGEFVIILQGFDGEHDDEQAIIDQHLALFLPDLPVKQAVKFTVALTQANKNRVYERALEFNEKE